jgi:hypothetical protein
MKILRRNYFITQILRNLWIEAVKQGGFIEGASYLQHRLRIGWGTARVGCGMVTHQLYHHIICLFV